MWLQTHLEMIEDTLLVSLGCCDFFEFHPSHGDLLAADGCQPFDDVTHGPLSIFVSTVGGEEGRQSLFHMPLHRQACTETRDFGSDHRSCDKQVALRVARF